MATSRLSISGDIGGATLNSTLTRSAEGAINHDPTLLAAKNGSLTTRTDEDTGTLTMGDGHGITTAAVIDIYWEDGRRYDVIVGTVAGNSVPFDGGSGDDLPTQGTQITAAVQQTIDTDFDGDLLVGLGALCAQKAHLGFFESGSNVLSVDLTANEAWFWLDGGMSDNPLAGHVVDQVKVTQGYASQTAALKLGVLYDSVT